MFVKSSDSHSLNLQSADNGVLRVSFLLQERATLKALSRLVEPDCGTPYLSTLDYRLISVRLNVQLRHTYFGPLRSAIIF